MEPISAPFSYDDFHAHTPPAFSSVIGKEGAIILQEVASTHSILLFSAPRIFGHHFHFGRCLFAIGDDHYPTSAQPFFSQDMHTHTRARYLDGRRAAD